MMRLADYDKWNITTIFHTDRLEKHKYKEISITIYSIMSRETEWLLLYKICKKKKGGVRFRSRVRLKVIISYRKKTYQKNTPYLSTQSE